MLRLLLFRHAKTERDSPTGRDRDRVLSETGRSDAPAIGSELHRLGFVPEMTLVSPAARTVETFELAAPQFSPRPAMRILPQLYAASPGELLQAVHDESPARASPLMVVAHNPGLHELALALIADGPADDLDALHDNLPPGAVAVIDFAAEDWSDITFRAGRLIRMITPKGLRQSAA